MELEGRHAGWPADALRKDHANAGFDNERG
jgi:hypothetical protein